VRVVQLALHAFAPSLAVDGFYGVRTEQAVLDYERSRNNPFADGVVDEDTWAQLTRSLATGTDHNGSGIVDPWELSAAAVCTPYRADYAYPMELCGRGEAVRTAQLALLGVDPSLVPDGYFGPRTLAAVELFQQLNGLPVTGRIDEPMWVALTGGSAAGYDADGDGIVDPWELGPSSGFPPPATELGGEPTIWAIVLGESTWEQDPGLQPLVAAVNAAGYSGQVQFCPDRTSTDGLGLGQAPAAQWIVAVPFLGQDVAHRARLAFAASGVPSVVALMRTNCFT
jgi:peptidoglycan hydrolase-like protein with peptidoglycan-binding domain